MPDDDKHPADEHIEALKNAIEYMKTLKSTEGSRASMRTQSAQQSEQAKSISNAVPRGQWWSDK